MKIRRLRLLLLSLFMTATVASALHTIEHAHHSADNCPVCLVSQHTASGDVLTPYQAVVLLTEEPPLVAVPTSIGRIHLSLPSARAPPFVFPIANN